MHPTKVEIDILQGVLPAQVHTASYQPNQISNATLNKILPSHT